VTTSDAPPLIEQMRAAWEARRLKVHDEDCPRCDTPACAIAKACKFAGASDFCKHSAALVLVEVRRAREANLRAAGVPLEFWPKVLNGGVDRARIAVGAVRRIVKGEGRLVVLAGTPGSGKTLAATLALAHVGGRFARAAELDQLTAEGATRMEELLHARFLVLDDAGAGRSVSEVAAPRVEELLAARWDRKRPSVVTTNCSRTVFWKHYGGEKGRIADRLRSDAIGWVPCTEESAR
jgi:DNA replication protein DnaC